MFSGEPRCAASGLVSLLAGVNFSWWARVRVLHLVCNKRISLCPLRQRFGVTSVHIAGMSITFSNDCMNKLDLTSFVPSLVYSECAVLPEKQKNSPKCCLFHVFFLTSENSHKVMGWSGPRPGLCYGFIGKLTARLNNVEHSGKINDFWT